MSTARPSHASGFQKYLETNDTSTAFTYSAAGVFTGEPATPHRVFPLGKALIASLVFFGVGAANTTFDYRVWFVHPVHAFPTQGNEAPSGLLLRTYAGGGTCILGTQTGVAGYPLVVADQFADSTTWIPSGVATSPIGPTVIAEGAFNEGASAAFTGGTPDNTHAFVFIPCLMRATGLIVDFDMTGATSGNCLIMADEI